MKKYFIYSLVLILMLVGAAFLITPTTHATTYDNCTTKDGGTNVNRFPACTAISTGDLGFQIPSLGDILTFTVRVFFVIAGLAALLYLLLGALAWITSGGDKDAVSAAQQKIQAAVIGMILIVAVLAIIWTLEQVVFKRRICLGLSCPLTLPGIIETSTGKSCCACVRKSDGKLVDVINSFGSSCNDDGTKYIPTSST
ncbi:hypothetical protein A3A93_03960 [Candidatus Roizmanbacteria bacterium RIFCSPLOWO2_01_FULL_38_12]|uniref:Vitamin K epoxide reductase domain-containing protein n=1 Tax=Candidatus Roizmanbacteria bacterium RIFCSPLOWO2_01_FULL_38_12 TaxID=1802061 RepID=A0A1F7ITX7_9BACT|nr:MAG: hypothetical protein A3A93_03960 [Candidatus Roizmanbacteria bacterium RIFCSPLOWO2_01_FULL_38_12]